MRKQLLALAVSAAVLPALAAAQGPDLYGKLNVAVEHVSAQDENGTPAFNVPALAGDRTSTWAVTSYKSRIGIKGDVELEVADLEGFYKAEWEIAADDGANSNGREFAQRDIYAGLRSGAGSLQLGRFNSPFKKAEGIVDQFNDYATDMGEGMVGQDRFSNSVQYTSPTLAEMVTVKLALIANENQSDFDGDGNNENTLADTVSSAVEFRSGGFYAAIAMNKDQEESLVLDSFGSSTIDAQRLVLAYQGDGFQLGALYQMAEENNGFIKGEETALVLSGAMSVERMKFKLQHQMVEGDQSEDELTVTTVGMDYALGKMSKAYTYYGMVDAESGAALGVDADGSILSFGLEHKF